MVIKNLCYDRRHTHTYTCAHTKSHIPTSLTLIALWLTVTVTMTRRERNQHFGGSKSEDSPGPCGLFWRWWYDIYHVILLLLFLAASNHITSLFMTLLALFSLRLSNLSWSWQSLLITCHVTIHQSKLICRCKSPLATLWQLFHYSAITSSCASGRPSERSGCSCGLLAVLWMHIISTAREGERSGVGDASAAVHAACR